MASNDKPDEPVENSWSPRRPRTAAEERAEATAAKGGPESTDPDVLAADIDRTREELAETLDAIADKVSPKKVAQRTTDKLKDDVRQGAESAQDSVVHGATTAAEAVKEQAASAAESVRAGVAAVKEKVAGDSDEDASPLTPATSVEIDAAVPVDGLGEQEPGGTPVTVAGEVPRAGAPSGGVEESPAAAMGGSRLAAMRRKPFLVPSTLPKPVLGPSSGPVAAGAGGALLLAGLLLRRRRRRGRRAPRGLR